MAVATSSKEHIFGSAYANAVGALPGANESWVDGLRQTARAILNTQGFPGPKDEAWKYTSLRQIEKTPYIPAQRADDVDVASLPITVPTLTGALKLVFVNGSFRGDLSDPLDNVGAGASLQLFSTVLTETPKNLKSVLGATAAPAKSFTSALNTSFMEQGAVLHVERDVALERPIQIISIGASGAQPGAFHPRFTFALKSGAQATVIESHVGLPGQSYLSNPVTEAVLDDGANLNHYTLISDDSDASHVGGTAVSAGQGAQYSSFILSLGGALVRREIDVALEGEGAAAVVDGAYGLSGEQHSDILSEINHLAPATMSNQTVKGVLGGDSHGVFQGRIHVARSAQKTDGRQLHKALLLNAGPEVNCKPELEIYADDVQCAHGATTGEMNPEHIFYLLSRGIDEKTARALLVEGFIDDVVLDIASEPVRDLILDMVKGWLARQRMLTADQS